jgi:TetR/AcrR family transcriptional regulator, regulator of cefoperazone and chloramphenicol sensitivity
MASPHVRLKGRIRGTPPTPVLPDGTRTRLLDSAGEIFAELGYQAATVREICARAGVNIALVNYHFGDKLELYAEVLRHSIGASKNEIIQKAIESSAPPEEALRGLIEAMLQRVCRTDRPGWHFQLMVHELARPTPAMSSVIDETMGPIYDRFRGLIGAILRLPPDHDLTRLCTHSVIGQVVHYVHARHVVSRLWPELELTPERIAQIATHIADFSLAYLRASAPRPNRAVSRRKMPRKNK